MSFCSLFPLGLVLAFRLKEYSLRAPCKENYKGINRYFILLKVAEHDI
jgi:hypothetical protein